MDQTGNFWPKRLLFTRQVELTRQSCLDLKLDLITPSGHTCNFWLSRLSILIIYYILYCKMKSRPLLATLKYSLTTYWPFVDHLLTTWPLVWSFSEWIDHKLSKWCTRLRYSTTSLHKNDFGPLNINFKFSLITLCGQICN